MGKGRVDGCPPSELFLKWRRNLWFYFIACVMPNNDVLSIFSEIWVLLRKIISNNVTYIILIPSPFHFFPRFHLYVCALILFSTFGVFKKINKNTIQAVNNVICWVSGKERDAYHLQAARRAPSQSSLLQSTKLLTCLNSAPIGSNPLASQFFGSSVGAYHCHIISLSNFLAHNSHCLQ